jgi:DNA (cytosine-5)-methyltransferase 1
MCLVLSAASEDSASRMDDGGDDDMPLTVGSLFSGIGGIDLGLERAGMVTRWFVEIDPHCRNVLARHWPGLPIYGDITAVDWSGVEPVDVLAGGFPCQPVSVAGRALAQADERWLWPAFRDAIGALRPRYVLVENVPGLLQRGLGIVLGDLAELGYDAEWECIPAAAVGAPHLRNRLWLIAYRPEQRRTLADAHDGGPRDTVRTGRDAAGNGGTDALADPYGPEWDERRQHRPGGSEGSGHVANAESIGWKRTGGARDRRSGLEDSGSMAHPDSAGLEGRAVQPERASEWAAGPFSVAHPDSESLGRLAESRGQRGQWLAEPDVGRVADGVPHRVDRLRALGNAVVPQVVEWIGRRIVAFDEGRVAA